MDLDEKQVNNPNDQISYTPVISPSVKIITDEPSTDAADFQGYAGQISKLIVNSTPPRFTVGIYGGWGTGKTTLMEMIKNDLDKNHFRDIETVWFDSWRYENENLYAMVPLLRTIILSINNKLRKISSKDKKYRVLNNLKDKFTKVGNAIIRNTNLNVGVKAGENFEAGADLDIGKMVDDYQSDGSFIRGQERVFFHKHISDHIKEELQKIRYDDEGELIYDFRLIIFVDDFDRCTPGKALELLESIKTFFDIEGIIYVIGIEPESINPIIKTKYGEGTKIDGMDYLQKIVQLPFQIPVWGAGDLFNNVRTMISKTGIRNSDINKILDRQKTNVEMIVKAAQLNPRDVKRFVNTIILALYVYRQSIKDIEKLIAIQAFYFRGNEWIGFLKLIISYDSRTQFLKHFITLLGIDTEDITSLADLKKTIYDITDAKKDYKLDKPTLEIFKRLIELDDNELFVFLRTSAKTLLRIDEMSKYLRALDTTMTHDKTGFLDSEKQYRLIKKQKIKEFNGYKQTAPIIHIPYVNLSSLNLNEIDLSKAFLFGSNISFTNLTAANLFGADISKSNLSGANLSGSDLSRADLSGANLSGANLSGAKLFETNLTKANLTKANLTKTHFFKAKLSESNLSWADLNGASVGESDLSRANLSESEMIKTHLVRSNFSQANMNAAGLREAQLFEADLSGADLSGADLSGADLRMANLSGADLNMAHLTAAKLSEANLSGADLSDAILVGIHDYSDLKVEESIFYDSIIDNSDLIDYLSRDVSKAKKIPDKIKNRLELANMLEGRVSKNRMKDYMRNSSLPV